jgi:hypothetical protein
MQTLAARGTSSERRSIKKEADMIGRGAIAMDPVSKNSNSAAQEDAASGEEAIDQIRESLRGLKFGSVNIIVQDGVVVQIDRTEKKRLRDNCNGAK